MSKEKEIINKILSEKSANIPLFDKDYLSEVHEKVMNRVTRANDEKPQQSKAPNKAEIVIQADKNFRSAVRELVISLSELGDKQIAQKLLGEHIIMLDSIFKDFE